MPSALYCPAGSRHDSRHVVQVHAMRQLRFGLVECCSRIGQCRTKRPPLTMYS